MYDEIRAYLACEGQRLDNEVYSLKNDNTIGSAFMLFYSVARRDAFNKFSKDIERLLDLSDSNRSKD